MELKYSHEMRQKMLAGIDRLADAVKVTLGPEGRNVTMYQKANLRDTEYSDPAQPGAHALVTNDGVTIAKSIILPDPMENMGAQFLRETAEKVNDEAGDGTSTAILLAKSILHEAFRNAEAGADITALKRGIKKAAERAQQILKESAKPIQTREDISRVAAISCEDEDLGVMIGEAMDAVGLEGVITIDDYQRNETMLDIQEGIVFDRGYLSSFMCTDEKKTVALLYDPYILFCDTKFESAQDLIPALMLAAEDERSCLIISEGVEGDALGLIYQNKIEGDMDIVCVNAPAYGEGRRWRMDDMAVQTGGVYVSKESGVDIREVTREMFGTAKQVKVAKKQTVITGAAGDSAAVEDRVKELRYLVDHTDYEFNRERYRERLAKFVSGVANIMVGGRTEPEMWERKMRVEDAVNAARAACEEGVVAGGGAALLHAAPEILKLADTLEGDERTGAKALAHALLEPVKQIAENAGEPGSVVAARLLEEDAGIGYDASCGCDTDMIAAGILDPLKVTRLALECAVSCAATVLTVEAGFSGRKGNSDEGKI